MNLTLTLPVELLVENPTLPTSRRHRRPRRDLGTIALVVDFPGLPLTFTALADLDELLVGVKETYLKAGRPHAELQDLTQCVWDALLVDLAAVAYPSIAAQIIAQHERLTIARQAVERLVLEWLTQADEKNQHDGA